MHTLKIDRSFVQSIDTGPERAAFVRAIVELADALSLSVVAEGVESAAHVAALRRIGCRLGQGFYFARPARARRVSCGGGRWRVEGVLHQLEPGALDRRGRRERRHRHGPEAA